MSRAAWLIAIVVVAFGYGAPAAQAQLAIPAFDNFDNPATGFELAGWTADAPSVGGVQWAPDATPTPVAAGGKPAWFSSPNSLNINNGTDYDGPGALALQTISSPWVDGTGLTILPGFMLAMDAEPDSDFLTVEYEDIVFGVFYSYTIGAVGSTTTNYVLPDHDYWWFDPVSIGGVTSFRVNFVFTSDATNNAYSGCFIDNFYVVCTDALAPTAPTLVSPIAGATVTNPVTLTWTGATDVEACGPGQVFEYVYEVDSTPAFGAPVVQDRTGDQSITLLVVGSGTWYWRVITIDQWGNSVVSTTESFYIEPPILPLPPSGLYVNEDYNGAQSGRSGSPLVIDTTPVFSAVYEDANTVDNALQLEYQISAPNDSLFMFLTTSGILTLPALLPKGTRCPDFTIGVNLNKDTVYYWRCRFADSGGFGAWSPGQGFRIGDGYDFGERLGSKNHSRKCWVATSAYGSAEASPVAALQAWRFGEMEQFSAGRMFSRAYHVTGRAAAPSVAGSGVVRLAVGSLAAVAGIPAAGFSIAVLALLAVLGLGRFMGR